MPAINRRWILNESMRRGCREAVGLDSRSKYTSSAKKHSFAHGQYLRIRERYAWMDILGMERAWKHVYGEGWERLRDRLGAGSPGLEAVGWSRSFAAVTFSSSEVIILMVSLVGYRARSKRTAWLMACKCVVVNGKKKLLSSTPACKTERRRDWKPKWTRWNVTINSVIMYFSSVMVRADVSPQRSCFPFWCLTTAKLILLSTSVYEDWTER